ncbi:CRISPR-associated endonuclease Cas3'' [Salipiger sp. P9]|uniref:CRISPR-associated endonuclease Cas3'' n=1 Tax=Salipiger pentaromativorans TaxID=2943193 RepID=UPI002157B37A|nr:CRISPR-associated endonuclease Cas3'' [Salipiger pentaromativorans]MCR8547608.1 CRISPR-associated endonuclease Cas3'' [Salipiger pentaromativorans]
MIYAHSLKDRGPADWETLLDHSFAVARSTRRNASAFAPELGEIIGWAHDLGKTKPRFQERLHNSDIHEPHAAAGARYLFFRQPHALSAIMAQIVLGHHAGLSDGGGPERLLRARLEEEQVLLPPEDWPVPRLTKRPTALAELDGKDLGNANYHFAFLGRMLFSALVDADRSETRAFYDRAEGRAAPEPEPVALDELRRRLDTHMAELSGEGPVNALRHGVHTHVRAQAARDPGLFSLTVPTGGGKTLAALGFALDHAIAHGQDRVIFVIPYTSIVEQTAAVFRKVLDDPQGRTVLEHHSAFDWQEHEDDEARDLKTAAERWDRPVIVTTAVQFFESLHAARTSPCRKLHRIANAVVILDEAQTLPRPLLRPSLAAIRELARGYRSSLVLCTATQPALLKEDGFPHPEALSRDGPLPLRELAPDPKGLYQKLKRVRVEQAGPLSNAALADRLAAPEGGLAILNNRRQARAVFELIRDVPNACHLSTNMTARHRRVVLEKVRGQLASGAPVRLVSTSLIEAGVDVSFPVVYRALAGLDSIVQAAGRCNRNAEGAEPGRVVVFEPAAEEAGQYKPPEELHQLAETARSVLTRFSEDPLSLEAINAYFKDVFWQKKQKMDAGKVDGQDYPILQAIANAGGGAELNLPYASVAKAFRMIPEGAMPVVIRGGDWGLPDRDWEKVQYLTSAGAVARLLQSYQVQIPEKARQKMLGAGLLVPLRETEFGLQFLLLDRPELYDGETGLKWDDWEDLGFLSY